MRYRGLERWHDSFSGQALRPAKLSVPQTGLLSCREEQVEQEDKSAPASPSGAGVRPVLTEHLGLRRPCMVKRQVSLVGKSAQMESVRTLIAQVADTPVPVLIAGETG